MAYVAGHLFNRILGTDFTITSDKRVFEEHKGPCINYSEEPIDRTLWIKPSGWLSGTGVKPLRDLRESRWKGLFVFFANDRGDIPFDLFSASFYLLALYEEHLPHRTDEHGRFSHTDSLLYQNRTLEIPVVDRWAYLLKEALEQLGYSTEDFRLRKYRAVSTYDIDHPFLYRNKGFIRNAGGAVKDLLKGHTNALKERCLVQLRLKEDPYFEALQNIHALQEKFRRSYHLFVLLGQRNRYGVSTVYSPQRYYEYIKQSDGVQIGLHPSYNTYCHLPQLLKEKAGLEKILGYTVDTSRRHFLRMKSPESFQELLLAGIREDFTLAFAKAPGFRSGTAVPYPFYDLQKEEETALWIHPTVMMDSTLIVHKQLTPEQGLDTIKRLIDECKRSGGDYLSLWHNSNLADTPHPNPWIAVFRQSYEYAIHLED